MDEIFQLLDYLGIQSQSTIQTYAQLAQPRGQKKLESLDCRGWLRQKAQMRLSGVDRG